MTDNFQSHAPGLTSPGSKHFDITPDDATDLDPRPRGIFVGGAGNVTIRDKDGTDCQYVVSAVPYVIPFRGVRVMATGTDATNLIGITD